MNAAIITYGAMKQLHWMKTENALKGMNTNYMGRVQIDDYRNGNCRRHSYILHCVESDAMEAAQKDSGN